MLIPDDDPRLVGALRRPWSVSLSRDERGEYVAHVAEFPDAIATGADVVTLEKELWDSLRESIRARLEFGDPIPKPKSETPIAFLRETKLTISQTPEFHAITAAASMLVP